jgi:hypothetical protein
MQADNSLIALEPNVIVKLSSAADTMWIDFTTKVESISSAS